MGEEILVAVGEGMLLLGGKAAQFNLTERTMIEFVQKLFDLETESISKFSLCTVQSDWLLKTRNHLKNMKRNSVQKNSRKLES